MWVGERAGRKIEVERVEVEWGERKQAKGRDEKEFAGVDER